MSDALTNQVDRILLGEVVTLAFNPVDRDEAARVVTAPATVTITDGDGTEVVSAAAATIAGDGKTLSYVTDPTKLAAYDSYTVVWSARYGAATLSWQTALEVCGGHLFSIATFQAQGGRLDTLTAAQVREARRQAEDRFETECDVAFVPRAARVTVKAEDVYKLLLPHVALRELYAVTVDDGTTETVLTETQLATIQIGDELAGAGVAYREDGDLWGKGDTVTLYYAHGYDRPAPHVSDAVMKLAREYVAPDGALPPRATSLSTDIGTFRISVASREHPTGIPDVDSVIELVGRKRPPVG